MMLCIGISDYYWIKKLLWIVIHYSKEPKTSNPTTKESLKHVYKQKSLCLAFCLPSKKTMTNWSALFYLIVSLCWLTWESHSTQPLGSNTAVCLSGSQCIGDCHRILFVVKISISNRYSMRKKNVVDDNIDANFRIVIETLKANS